MFQLAAPFSLDSSPFGRQAWKWYLLKSGHGYDFQSLKAIWQRRKRLCPGNSTPGSVPNSVFFFSFLFCFNKLFLSQPIGLIFLILSLHHREGWGKVSEVLSCRPGYTTMNPDQHHQFQEQHEIRQMIRACTLEVIHLHERVMKELEPHVDIALLWPSPQLLGYDLYVQNQLSGWEMPLCTH